MRARTIAVAALCGPASAFDLVINPKNAPGASGGRNSVPIDISQLRNNRAFGLSVGDASYDVWGTGFPAQFIPPENFTYGGVNFNFPQYQKNNGSDNVLAEGQTLTVPKGRYIGLHILTSGESGLTSSTVKATYADNTTTTGSLLVDPFWNWPYPYGGDIVFPYYLSNTTVDYNQSMIYRTVTWLDSTKELVNLQLPNTTSGTAKRKRIHLFALSLVPAQGTGLDLEVQLARSTNTWFEGTNKTQIVEAVINNVGTDWVLANNSVQITVVSNGTRTVQPGIISRLRPGDQARVQIGVVNADGVIEGTEGVATISITGNGLPVTNYTFNATYGIPKYDPTYASIYAHEPPPWYQDSKYGIFIHWGVYAVPGWGNVGKKEGYAEWYWWDMGQGNGTKTDTWQYNLQTYGPSHNYDDFIPEFTASAFDPKSWVDLFSDAGANYFVQVSKHHDGYALFDLPANVSQRTSVALPPHRNLLKELFEAAATYQPHLHRATYFSLPEWFNPAYQPFGFGEWPGGNATNPYTNATLPYTGFVPVSDYVSDVIVPSMQALADMGTEIMWCDIGGPNLTAQFAAEWFNTAAQQGKQVLTNNRCGTPGDFDTPEYARYDAVQARKWESNLGLDPYSYGYNGATPDNAYLAPDKIVTSLVDIVSKNGNFLLDVGPTANGTIIQVEQDNLRAAGSWIKTHAEAIFNTTYWYITPQEGAAVRFTQTLSAFYITTLYQPNATIVLNSPVPYVSGDNITVVGGNMSGTVVPSRLLGNGSLQINVSEAVQNADRYAWVFKISYAGNISSTAGGGNGTTATPTASGGGVATQTTSVASGTGPLLWLWFSSLATLALLFC